MLNFANTYLSPYQRAMGYLDMGWSVIPLIGDKFPQRAKSPGIPSWKPYQFRQPTLLELDHWFNTLGYSAIGIVLGQVSNIVVLDIDRPQRAAQFLEFCPDLAQTFVVESGNRRLPHYYFALPDGMVVNPRTFMGAELRSDGQYVVAAGTSIEGHEWRVVNDQPLKMLSPGDLRRLYAFIDNRPAPAHFQGAAPLSAPSVPIPEKMLGPALAVPANPHPVDPPLEVSALQLVAYYRRLASEIGRNNALFKAGCFGRDCGWSQAAVIDALAEAHIRQPTFNPHKSETPQQRMIEALRTITSVFTRPARRTKGRSRREVSQLPNALREYLLQAGLDNLARVLDGLLFAGFRTGDEFTADIACARLKPLGIGRNTVYEALKATLADNVVVFAQGVSDHPAEPETTGAMGTAWYETAQSPAAAPGAAPSPLNPPSPLAYAARRYAGYTNQCLIGRVAKPGKNRGRPGRVFLMPDVGALCETLKLDSSRGGDLLESSALRSPAAYRAALHVALIERAPGRYARAWQATRLGICEDTCRRYERAAGVIVTPVFREWSLNWAEVDRRLSSEPLPGCFIEDENGKRYPPLPQVARKLLAGNHRLLYKSQEPNYYGELPAAELPQTTRYYAEEVSLAIEPLPALNRYVVRDEATGFEGRLHPGEYHDPPERERTSTPPPFSAPLPDSQRVVLILRAMPAPDSASVMGKHDGQSPPTHLPEKTTFGEHLYNTVRSMNPDRSLTRKNADQLVIEYGEALIRRGLSTLKRRRNIRNPAGFLRIWLRSEQRSADAAIRF